MLQHVKRILFLAMSAAIIISCGNDDDQVEELPEWNKDRTAVIQVYSRLNNEPLFKDGDYTGVTSRLGSRSSQVAVLHRADVVYGAENTENPTVSVAAGTGKVSFFACNNLSSGRAEGTGILIGHTVASMECIPVSSGCTWFSVPVKANNYIDMTFASISFEHESQVTPGIEVIRKNMNDKTVLVGLADQSLKNMLAAGFSSSSYRLVPVESTGAGQFVFVLTTLKWIVREHTEMQVGDGDMVSFDIQIEAL